MRNVVLVCLLWVLPFTNAAAAPQSSRARQRNDTSAPVVGLDALRAFDAAGEPLSLETPALSGGVLPPPAQGRRTTGRLVAGGLLGGAVRFFGGGIAGAAVACESADVEDDLCAVGGFLTGASIADSALLPLGVHLANDTRGNYLLELLASSAIAGVALGLASIEGNGIFLIPVPPLQLAASIAIERSTAR